jgi:hypothetical protein
VGARFLTTWAAFVAAVCLALPQPPPAFVIGIGTAVGAVLIHLGFRAADQVRPAVSPAASPRTSRAALSLLTGAVLGAVLLGVLGLWVGVEPSLRARFASRLDEPYWRPLALAIEASILEEVAFRLFAMSVLAWLAARLLKAPGWRFPIALVGSAVLFGLAHLPAWATAAAATPVVAGAVLLLNGTGGVVFGWVFWRWGLPYAVLCHFAGDVVTQSLGPRVLGS